MKGRRRVRRITQKWGGAQDTNSSTFLYHPFSHSAPSPTTTTIPVILSFPFPGFLEFTGCCSSSRLPMKSKGRRYAKHRKTLARNKTFDTTCTRRGTAPDIGVDITVFEEMFSPQIHRSQIGSGYPSCSMTDSINHTFAILDPLESDIPG